MSDERYFNFPVQLLQGLLIDSQKVLNNIMDYCIYENTFELEYGTLDEKIKDSASFYNIILGSISRTKKNGKELYNNLPENPPKVGMNLSIFWDFYKNDKSDFDKICLLGFLAIKSILQQKPYCKIDNKFWFARMDGKAKSCEIDGLSDKTKKYFNNYQARKIKSELQDGWGLITYSRYTRGFYVSFKLTLSELVYEAEKRRRKTKEKHRKEEEKKALKEAMDKLKLSQP